MALEEKYFPAKDDPELQKKIEKAAESISSSNHLVAFTGAGISTESGIPDYRGPQGVWTLRDQGKKAKASVPWSKVAPNSGHMALYHLQEMGILKFLISQNVDNLHLKSGIDPKSIAELHGNSVLMKCIACDKRFSKQEIGWDGQKFGKGYRTQKPVKGQPDCPECHGRIISSIVNFGDPMPQREMELSEQNTIFADVFIAIGSSLAVTPASGFPYLLKEKKNPGTLIIINLGESQLDHLADIHISGKAGEILAQIVHIVEHKRGKM